MKAPRKWEEHRCSGIFLRVWENGRWEERGDREEERGWLGWSVCVRVCVKGSEGGGDKTKKKRKRFERLMRQNLAEPRRAEPRAISWDVSDVAVLPFEFWPHFVCFVFFCGYFGFVFFSALILCCLHLKDFSLWRESKGACQKTKCVVPRTFVDSNRVSFYELASKITAIYD